MECITDIPLVIIVGLEKNVMVLTYSLQENGPSRIHKNWKDI